DVDVPERVLDDLGEFRFGRRGDRYGLLDQLVVERLYRGQRGLVDTRDDLGRADQRPGLVAWVDSLWAVAQVKVGAGDQARAVLQPRLDLLGGSARPRGRLDDHGRAMAQVPGERAAGRLDVGQVRQSLAQRGGHRDHRDVETCAASGFR